MRTTRSRPGRTCNSACPTTCRTRSTQRCPKVRGSRRSRSTACRSTRSATYKIATFSFLLRRRQLPHLHPGHERAGFRSRRPRRLDRIPRSTGRRPRNRTGLRASVHCRVTDADERHAGRIDPDHAVVPRHDEPRHAAVDERRRVDRGRGARLCAGHLHRAAQRQCCPGHRHQRNGGDRRRRAGVGPGRATRPAFHRPAAAAR